MWGHCKLQIAFVNKTTKTLKESGVWFVFPITFPISVSPQILTMNRSKTVSASSAASSTSGADAVFTIVTGSYEHALIGMSVSRATLKTISRHVIAEKSKPTDAANATTTTDASEQMPTIFARTCHTGSIRAVAVSSQYLVTGSTDETMRLFAFRRKHRRELGVLNHHAGAVNALALFGQHALSASDDGTVAVWKTGREWKLHAILGNKKKAPILDLAVHPTGRVLLTVGKDRRLNMWNLVTAQLIYKQQHPAESQRVAWSPTGAHYALVQDKRVLVFTDSNELLKTFESEQPFHAAVFSPDGSKIAAAGEDKQVYVYSLPAGKRLWVGTAHQRRIKDLRFLDNDFLVSACSLGDVCVWNVATGHLLLTRKLDCRINSIAVAVDVGDEGDDAEDSVEFDGQGNDDDEDDDDDDDDEGGYVIDHDAGRGDDDDVDDEEGDVIVGNDDDDDNRAGGNNGDDEDEEDDDAEFQKAIANNFRDYEQLAVENVDSGVSAYDPDEDEANSKKKKKKRTVVAAQKSAAKKAKRRNDGEEDN